MSYFDNNPVLINIVIFLEWISFKKSKYIFFNLFIFILKIKFLNLKNNFVFILLDKIKMNVVHI